MPDPAVFAGTDPVFHPGMDPVRGVDAGQLGARQPRRLAGRLDTCRLYRQPSSVSNRVSCAPGWGAHGGRTLAWTLASR